MGRRILLMRSRYILTSADIRIWRSASEKCSDLNLRKILTIRMYRKAQRNFGEGGIFLLERGLESMYIFLSAAIDVRFREIYLT